ncbi:MAG: hypothetical protein CM1200mP10_04480 [Candidatus Neomarinimicrobiota bacterium]|nr:MAG: hypothetical protein CM1200mP10_04480 [Candidatus Neomarinimicrobiota bacterium]
MDLSLLQFQIFGMEFGILKVPPINRLQLFIARSNSSIKSTGGLSHYNQWPGIRAFNQKFGAKNFFRNVIFILFSLRFHHRICKICREYSIHKWDLYIQTLITLSLIRSVPRNFGAQNFPHFSLANAWFTFKKNGFVHYRDK